MLTPFNDNYEYHPEVKRNPDFDEPNYYDYSRKYESVNPYGVDHLH